MVDTAETRAVYQEKQETAKTISVLLVRQSRSRDDNQRKAENNQMYWIAGVVIVYFA